MRVVWFKVFLCAVGNSFQTLFAFSFLALVTPVTYSVCCCAVPAAWFGGGGCCFRPRRTVQVANVAKRIVLIVSGALIFQNPITFFNGVGIAITMASLFAFAIPSAPPCFFAAFP
jgi:hypothetical protein